MLQIPSKNCNLRDVSAEEYRQELVCDAFVNGLASRHIRRRLSENTELPAECAYRTAMSLYMAQEHSATYYSKTKSTSTVFSEDDHRSANAKDLWNVSHENKDKPTATKQALHLIATTKSKCFFCGRAYHERKYYICFLCKKIRHFSRVCRSNNGSGKRLKSANQGATLSLALFTYIYGVPGKSAKICHT